MGIISVRHKGNFRKTETFFTNSLKRNYIDILNRYGEKGVRILKEATPSDSGETASRWKYSIERSSGTVSLIFKNDNENQGANIVKLIVFGHGLWNGGYVAGNNFVSPAIEGLLKQLANEAWREVTK